MNQLTSRASQRQPTNFAVPLRIARLIRAQHPFFFSTAPTRTDIIERLVSCLDCTRSLGGEFQVSFEETTEKDAVTATLLWRGDPELAFIASGMDSAESLFRATLRAMEHPRFANCFAQAMDCSTWVNARQPSA